jgi:Zn-dependent peptidase ImmA (M78 family)
MPQTPGADPGAHWQWIAAYRMLATTTGMDTPIVEPLALNLTVLSWATEKAGLTPERFAVSVSKKAATQARIRSGRLTPAQAAKLSKLARIPFGYLFLNEPPQIKRPTIPDLRQIPNAEPLGENFYEVLADVFARQQWYRDYLSEGGERPLAFVGSFPRAGMRDAARIVLDIRQKVGFSDTDRRTSSDPAAYFGRLAEKIESSGVLVMKASFVKSATKRSLSEREFRGFAIADAIVPTIFVNGRDAETAAVFTLIHELAHIWLGISGVTDMAAKPTSHTEKICNAVAGEILVPEVGLRERWSGEGSLEQCAAFFRVSRLVVARRALDLGMVDQDFYDQVARATRPAKSSGPVSGLVTIPIRNSKRFTRTVVAEAMSGNTLLREAAALLNVRPDTIVSLAKERRKNG